MKLLEIVVFIYTSCAQRLSAGCSDPGLGEQRSENFVRCEEGCMELYVRIGKM